MRNPKYKDQWVLIVDHNYALGPFNSAEEAAQALIDDWVVTGEGQILRLREAQ